MAELEVRIIKNGIVVASTYITAETEEEIASELIVLAEDSQNGQSEWLEGAFDE